MVSTGGYKGDCNTEVTKGFMLPMEGGILFSDYKQLGSKSLTLLVIMKGVKTRNILTLSISLAGHQKVYQDNKGVWK